MLENTDITIYHKRYNEETREDEWSETYYPSVNWLGKQAVSVGDNGLNTADRYIVRIPTGSGIDVAKGDYMVIGKGGPVSRIGELKDKILITYVGDNRRGPPVLHHWKIEGM